MELKAVQDFLDASRVFHKFDSTLKRLIVVIGDVVMYLDPKEIATLNGEPEVQDFIAKQLVVRSMTMDENVSLH